jgi:hypothetical protein
MHEVIATPEGGIRRELSPQECGVLFAEWERNAAAHIQEEIRQHNERVAKESIPSYWEMFQALAEDLKDGKLVEKVREAKTKIEQRRR